MGYAISPVQYELGRTGDILGQGFRDAGQRAIRKEELGLKRAVTEADLKRQAKMDAIQRPALELGAEQARMGLEKLNQPVSVASLFPDAWALTHASYVPEGEQKSLAEKVGDLFGATVDVNKQSPTYGKYVRSDGTVLTNKDLMSRGKELQATILANTDPVHAVNDQVGRYVERLSNLPEGDPRTEKTKENLRNAIQWLEKPEMQLRTLEKQREYLSRLEGPEFEKGVARLDAKITNLKNQMAEAVKAEKDLAWKREELATKESGLNKREGMKEANANERAWLERQEKPRQIGETREIKVGNEIHTQEWNGWKWETIATGAGKTGTERKESYQDKAQIDMLKDEAKTLFERRNSGMVQPDEVKQIDTRLLQIKKELREFGLEPSAGQAAGGNDPFDIRGSIGGRSQSGSSTKPEQEARKAFQGGSPRGGAGGDFSPKEEPYQSEAQRYGWRMGTSPDVIGAQRAVVGPSHSIKELKDFWNWLQRPKFYGKY